MEWARYIQDMVEILAWPIVVLSIVWLLRAQIRDLLRSLRRARGSGLGSNFDFEFGERVTEARLSMALADVAKPTDEAPSKEGPSRQAELDDALTREFDALRIIADAEPRAAILQAWTMIEREMERLESDISAPPQRHDPLGRIFNLGIAYDLPHEIVSAVTHLRQLRNVAAHRQETIDISQHSSYEYIGAVRDIISVLRLK